MPSAEAKAPPGPPDAVVNPTLVVAVGRFGHEVLHSLEAHASHIGEVLGAVAVRNQASLRLLTDTDLEGVLARGYAQDAARAATLWLPTEAPRPLESAFAPGSGHLACRTPDLAAPAEPVPAYEALKRLLLEVVAGLFRVDRFLDYHPDLDPFASRLDVYVVADLRDPLCEPAHLAVQRALAELVAGPLAPLFRSFRSNLAITHLAAFPVLEAAEVVGATRRLVARYRMLLEEIGEGGTPVAARFVFLEDRTFRYVVGPEHLQEAFSAYLTLLLFRRGRESRALRDLVHPVPALDRMAKDRHAVNQLCGAFSVATIEAPIHRIVRYCRNRQAIALLNAYLGRAQDGEPAAAEDRDIPNDIRELQERFGPEGRISLSLESALRRIEEREETDRSAFQAKHLPAWVGAWGISAAGEWEYHADLVDPYHADLQDPGRPRYTDAWLRGHVADIGRFARRLVEQYLKRLFDDIERAGRAIVEEELRTLTEDVDGRLGATPSGWKDALRIVERALEEVDGHLGRWRDVLARTRLSPPDPEPVRHAWRQRRSLESLADDKPVLERARRSAVRLGLAAGVALGAVVITIAPVAPAGLLWAVAPAAAGAWAALWFLWTRRRNAALHADIGALVSDERTCGLGAALDEICERWFSLRRADSWAGERFAWSAALWRLRVWGRLRAHLSLELERLADIGAALDAQLARFREDQEGLGVRYAVSDDCVREDEARVLGEGRVFLRQLVPSSCLGGLYAVGAEPGQAFARLHLAEEDPYDGWRLTTPFADLRALKDFALVPHRPLLEADLMQLPATAEAARHRLTDFLGDFTHKLALQGDRTWTTSEEDDTEDHLVLLAKPFAGPLRELAADLAWPESWSVHTDAGDRHSVTLLRHVGGLLPWELAALGTPDALVRDLLESGGTATLVRLVRSMGSLQLRLRMAMEGLEALVERDPESCRALLLAAGADRIAGQGPVDGAVFSAVARARRWAEPLVGSDGLLELLCLAYGTRMAASDDVMASAVERAELILLAAEGQADWALQALVQLPARWVHPMVRAVLRAISVENLVARRELEPALDLLERLEPETLRASTLLRTLLAIDRVGAHEWLPLVLDLAELPVEDEHPPMPAAFNPRLEELERLLPAASDHPRFVCALAAVYADRQYAELDREDPERRVRYLLAGQRRGDPSEVFRVLSALPSRYCDPRLLIRVRSAAT